MQFFAIYIFLTNFYQLGFANNKDGNVGQCTIESRSNCHTDESIGSKEDHSKGPSGIYSEETNVIMTEMRSALNEYEPCVPDDDICICHAAVIANDMKPFRKNGISKEIIESTAKYGTRYKIFNHKLYREEQCMFPARCSGVEHFIRGLLPHAKDMDLVVNTRDWPQSQGGFGKKLPVFSFSKTKDYSDIMYPAWSFWAGGPAISLHPTGIGRWDLQREKLIRAANDTSWEKKLSVGFFRGSRTSSERDSLVLLSRKRPELVNAKYTKNQAWKSLKDTLNAEPAQEVSFEDHCRYKYLFNFRGVAASFRFKHLFLCKSLIFHVGNEWQEFFYYAMKPWLHYVPLSSSPSQEEIEQIIKFFQKHDDLAKEIADRGFQFIRDHLRMKDVQCYWDHLLTEYQKLLRYEVQPDMDMKEI